jgi:hypothetical protein
MLKSAAVITILFNIVGNCCAQTFWLERFAPSNPKSPPAQLRVEPPTHTDVGVAFITIIDDLLIVGDHNCHARLSPSERKIHIKFDQWEEVEEIGGYEKFRANIIKHLKSDPETWGKVMWMKEVESKVPDYVGECGLLKGARRIYFGRNDVIIPDNFHGYYRYVKGAPATFYRTMEEAERRRIEAAEESRKLEERLLKGAVPIKSK